MCTSPVLPFPGRLLHRKVRKDGAVVEVRTRHTLWPKMPIYWDKIAAVVKQIGSNLGLPGYMDNGINVLSLASKGHRLHNGIGGTPVSDSPTTEKDDV